MTSSAKAFHRKSRNNEPLTDEETSIVQKELQSTSNKVKILQDEVDCLQSRLGSLIQEKQALSAFVAGHRGLLSPARRLIPEVLQEIFYHCLPTAHNALMSSKEAPLLLSRVCYQWRSIALRTPKLWASVHIIAGPSASLAHTLDISRREAISTWLRRSGVLPLSISMSIHEHEVYGFSRRCGPPLSNDRVQPYLDLILPFASRWKFIYFNLPHFDWQDFLTQLTSSQLPLLESIHIEGNRPFRRRHRFLPEASPLERGNSIIEAPSLRMVSLPTYHTRLLKLPIPWIGITKINLGARSLPLEVIYKVLTMCTNLEVCRLFVRNPGDNQESESYIPGTDNMIPLTMSKLRTLEVLVEPDWYESTTILFELLYVPALRHLSYEWDGRLWWGPVVEHESGSAQLLEALCLFLKRSNFSLEELELRIAPFSTTWAKKILPLVPNLKRLSLKGYDKPSYGSPGQSSSCSMNDDLLSCLIPNGQVFESAEGSLLSSDDDDDDFISFPAPKTPPQRCLCSRLEVLHCTNTEFSGHHLLNFLHSRTIDHLKHNVAHLRRVSVFFGNGIYPPVDLDTEGIVEFKRKVARLERETGVLIDVRFGLMSPPPEDDDGNDQKTDKSRRNPPRLSSSPYRGLDLWCTLKGKPEWEYFGF